VTVYYDPLAVTYNSLRDHLKLVLRDVEPLYAEATAPVDIPVCYGGDYGPDLALVAKFAGITETEVVRLHTDEVYTVYMIGFAPGFPYLGGLDSRIAMPRRATPRVSIPAGSVGIAGAQTGVYPNESPGGWQVIGRTPIQLFDAEKLPPSLLRPGNTVRFHPISEDEYRLLKSPPKGGGTDD
jgi:inhibitor of KinA